MVLLNDMIVMDIDDDYDIIYKRINKRIKIINKNRIDDNHKIDYRSYMNSLKFSKRKEIIRKRMYYFWKVPMDIQCLIQMDETSSWSVTHMDLAYDTTMFIREVMSEQGHSISNMTITDSTACIGGNTMDFSRQFLKVNAIEIDPIRFQFLKNNCSIKGLCTGDRISLYHGDCIDVMRRIECHDIIFIDPPWGGPGFDKRNSDGCKLYLSGMDVIRVCKMFRNACKYFALKVPYNFDIGMISINKNLCVLSRKCFSSRCGSPKFYVIVLMTIQE